MFSSMATICSVHVRAGCVHNARDMPAAQLIDKRPCASASRLLAHATQWRMLASSQIGSRTSALVLPKKMPTLLP